MYLLICKLYLVIFGYFEKIGFTLTCHHFRNSFFGLDSLQGPQLTTNTKKATHHCFAWNNHKSKDAFFQNLKNMIFQLLR